MYFKKSTVIFVLLAFAAICESKRRAVKTKKIRRGNHPNVLTPPCVCQNPLLDVVNCGCQGAIIETLGALAPLEISIPGYQTPIIDIPNYRYPETLEVNPLACLFPSIEIPNYGLFSPPMTLPSVEYFALDLPCGCPGPNCECRGPKVPMYPEYVASIEVPNCGFQGIKLPGVPAYSYGIEIPSYAPGSLLQITGGYRSAVAPICGCQGPCNCAGGTISACGCQEPCSCAEFQILSCGCQGSCSCPGIQIAPCGCPGSCGCSALPASCTCAGCCGCPNIQATVGILPTVEVASCGCPGSCACSGIQRSSGLLPAIEVPSYGYGCGCGGGPGCICPQYLRQVNLQPPFL